MFIGSFPPWSAIWAFRPARYTRSATLWRGIIIRFPLPKPDGGCRVLSVPDPLLKMIQRRIVRVLLAPMPVSPYAMAYRYGTGTVRNAALHAGRPAVLKLDIRHFFDSILYASVKEAAFPAEIYGEPLRILLTILCYYREGLPQGAPSSPAISNLVMRTFDDEAAAWCRRRAIRYTRYCVTSHFPHL